MLRARTSRRPRWDSVLPPVLRRTHAHIATLAYSVLNRAERGEGAMHPEAARAWLAFIRSPDALKIFERYGFKPYHGDAG
jgi:hypothetical protein